MPHRPLHSPPFGGSNLKQTHGIDLESVARRLHDDRSVRRSLPHGGRVHVDRRLPFLCVHRRIGDLDDGTERLVTGEAAYLRTSAAWSGLEDLLTTLAGVAVDAFGAFQLVELWAAASADAPHFTVHSDDPSCPVVRALLRSLEGHRLAGREVEVVQENTAAAPPGLTPLGTGAIGLAIAPVYRDDRGRLLPAVHSQLQRLVSRALKQAMFVFAKEQTTHRPAHWHSLGRRAVTRAVWAADRGLSAVGGKLDFLMMVTPFNTERAWQEFRDGDHRDEPAFRYREWPADPTRLLRELFEVPVQRIEDPTLRDLFEQKRVQLERKINMLRDRGTPAFLYGSQALLGVVDERLLRWALHILQGEEPSSSSSGDGGQEPMTVPQFVERAEEEIAGYRQSHARFGARVKVRHDVTGLLASHGDLLVSATLGVTPARADALLHHEVGTHLLCHYNAAAQPFQVLRMGLPGYEELQEGLALLAEFLAGGLTRSRVRVLAGRVLAVRRTCDGATFVELFHELLRHGFLPRVAFTLCMRSHRSGGFTKDACYLRGLQTLAAGLADGLELEPLFVGKIALEHLPIIEELTWRGVLRPVPLRPRYLEDPAAQARLQQIRRGADVLDLLEETS